MAKNIVRLTESEMNRLVKRIVSEQTSTVTPTQKTKVSACSKEGLRQIKNVIKNAPTFTIEVDPNNPHYVIIREPSGKGCACKREEIFILN